MEEICYCINNDQPLSCSTTGGHTSERECSIQSMIFPPSLFFQTHLLTKKSFWQRFWELQTSFSATCTGWGLLLYLVWWPHISCFIQAWYLDIGQMGSGDNHPQLHNSVPLSPPSSIPLSIPFLGPLSWEGAQTEVDSLLHLWALESVPLQHRGRGFYLRYFLVPKKKGGWTPIWDHREMNVFICYLRFSMITLAFEILSLNQWDGFTALDLKDAYFQIDIHPVHRKFLRIAEGLDQ